MMEKNNLWALGPAMIAFAAMSAAGAVSVNYRDPGDGRAWAVVFDAAEPLVLQWEEGAVSATLSSSNLATRAVSVSAPVARGAAPDGSCAIPFSGEGQQVLDVTLAQSDGASVISEKTVRLLVGNSSVVYGDAAGKPFRNVVDARVYPWSDRWADESQGASAAALSTAVKDGAAIGSWALPATGGYGVLSPKTSFGGAKGPVTAELSFDGVARWTAELFMESLGTAIFFR